jgi:hypothetical protein
MVSGRHGQGNRGDRQGPEWAARYLNVLRVAGLVVAALLALPLSSWTSLLVTTVVFAAFDGLITATARSAPRPTTAATAATAGH